MIATSSQQFEILLRKLRQSHEFDPLREKIESLAAQRAENLVKATEMVDVYRLQGEIKALTELRRLLTAEVAKREQNAL
jgi:hypothetical protein